MCAKENGGHFNHLMKNVNNLVAIYQTSTYVDNSDCLINVIHNGFTSAVSESYITELRKHPE